MVCLNVPIARTGWYKYLAKEIGLDGDEVVDVYRGDDEVFDPAAMASLEGKPLTDNHPADDVDPNNFGYLAKGHMQNIRRGSEDEDGTAYLMADIIANDQQIIRNIMNGKREVSVGYECTYVPNGDGTYSQTKIRGNHIALVDDGRAGDRVRIKDANAYPKAVGHSQLTSMIDLRSHNHISESELYSLLNAGGERWMLTDVDPRTLRIEDEHRLEGVRDTFDPSAAKPIIVGPDGFVIDGRHRVASAKRAGVPTMRAYTPSLRREVRDGMDEAEQAAKKYGISVKKDGHRSPPEGYPEDREQYADPVNYKYPLDGKHARDAVDYYNRPGERQDGDYTPEEWSKLGRRIVDKLGDGYELKDGKIITPDEQRDKSKARDSRMGFKKALKKPVSATKMLMAEGWRSFVRDAEPEEIVDAMDVLNDELKDEDSKKAPEEDKAAKDEAPDVKGIDELKQQVAALTEMVQKLAEGKKTEDEDPEKAIDAAIEELEKGDKDDDDDSTTVTDEDGVVSPEDDRPKDGFKTHDSAVAFLKQMKPAIAAIKDPAERKKVADAALKAVKGVPNKPSNTYAQMQRGARKTAKDAQKTNVVDLDDLKHNIMSKFNPHHPDFKASK